MSRPATIQKISEIRPIENADAIELCQVLGWQVVVKKGEFRVGDTIIYIEIDSTVPETPEFEFLRKNHFRVRTIRLRQELSQGLVIPCTLEGVDVGDDVSEILGITHYEKPLPAQMSGIVKGNFPKHLLPRTDEERLQSIPTILDELMGIEVYSSVKLDGTSATYIMNKGDFEVCSRNLSFKLIPENDQAAYIQIEKKYDIGNKLKAFGKNIAIQGEIVGPGIQKNRLGLKELDFFVFDVYDLDIKRYLSLDVMLLVCDELGLKHVPIIDTFNLDHNIDELLVMAEGKYEGTKNLREGIVIRPVQAMYSNVLGKRASFKVLQNAFLLKEGE